MFLVVIQLRVTSSFATKTLYYFHEVRCHLLQVDEFYDRNVKLVMAADRQLMDLYDGHRLRFEFQRTVSRLQEMQSHDYLAREHRP